MDQINRKKRVLFICTHNSARSQMAEGLLRSLYGDRYEAYSGGTDPLSVNPYAVIVMAEIGIDISSLRLKNVDKFLGKKFDYIVTVCDHAKETCPFFQGGEKYLHKNFENPAEFKGEEDKIKADFRRIRNEIKDWIEETFSCKR